MSLLRFALTTILCIAVSNGQTSNKPTWSESIFKAKALVAQMTLEELNNVTYGYKANNGCSGNSGGVPRLDFPGFCLSDGPTGVHSDLATGFAAGVSVAASFNRALAHRRAHFMGKEYKKKGAQVANAPVVGPMGRVAKDGRAWEGFGNDPYLNGQLAFVTVQGIQESVITATKHFLGNEQETARFPKGFVPFSIASRQGSRPSISANIDDATLHELYLWPFQDAVHAGTGSIMCSYNRVNYTYACENDAVLNQLLKKELAFPGFVLSDWYAQHSSLPSAKGGLDMAMPDSPFWNHGTLEIAVKNGSLPKERLEDMATRIIGAWYHITGPNSSFPLNGVGLPVDRSLSYTPVDARDPASKPSTRQSAIEGHVLVKNLGALPLHKPQTLSLFGYDGIIPKANTPTPGAYSGWGFGLQSVNISSTQILQVILNSLANPPLPQSAILGTLIGGAGSGSTNAPLWVDPYSAILHQAEIDDTQVYWDFQSLKPSVAAISNACLVFINDDATEGADRSGLADPGSDSLVKNVASTCNNTVVIIHNAWIRVVDAWIDHPNVTAVIFAHLPGQQSGNALADILYGRTSPSGRLPYTVAKNESDYGALLSPFIPADNNTNPYTNFTEGLLTDYRHFLANSIEPRFAFGFGLTYSNFLYGNVTCRSLVQNPPSAPPNPTAIIPGGISSLFENVASAQINLTNSGKVAAAEVAQLYVRFPSEEKLHHLRGFSKKLLKPNETTTVLFNLTRRDLSRWDVVKQSWVLPAGSYGILVGRSSYDIVSNTSFTFGAE